MLSIEQNLYCDYKRLKLWLTMIKSIANYNVLNWTIYSSIFIALHDSNHVHTSIELEINIKIYLEYILFLVNQRWIIYAVGILMKYVINCKKEEELFRSFINFYTL